MSIKTGYEYVGYIDPWTDEERLSDEEIVRCRDCMHMHRVRHWSGIEDECWLHADPESGALGKEPTVPNGYCAWGERRADA